MAWALILAAATPTGSTSSIGTLVENVGEAIGSSISESIVAGVDMGILSGSATRTGGALVKPRLTGSISTAW